MRTYERNGVHVDQCTECRGIFLDRGELEKLIDAENSWHGEPTPPAASPAQGSQLGQIVGEVLQQARASKTSYPQQGYGHGYKHKKKKSFLDELFG